MYVLYYTVESCQTRLRLSAVVHKRSRIAHVSTHVVIDLKMKSLEM